jgi:hypothetical protein
MREVLRRRRAYGPSTAQLHGTYPSSRPKKRVRQPCEQSHCSLTTLLQLGYC